jgi:hypothetical protein
MRTCDKKRALSKQGNKSIKNSGKRNRSKKVYIILFPNE